MESNKVAVSKKLKEMKEYEINIEISLDYSHSKDHFEKVKDLILALGGRKENEEISLP